MSLCSAGQPPRKAAQSCGTKISVSISHCDARRAKITRPRVCPLGGVTRAPGQVIR